MATIITKEQFKQLFLNKTSYDAYKTNPSEGFSQYVGGGLNTIIDLAEQVGAKMVKNCLYYGDFVFIATCDPRVENALLVCHESTWGAISLRTETLDSYIKDALRFIDVSDIGCLGEFLSGIYEASKSQI